MRSLLAAAIVGLLSSATAQAQEIRYDAPVGCMDIAAFRAEVLRLVGHDFDLAGEPIVVRVEPAEEGWRAKVSLSGGERELFGGSCDSVTSAAAIVTAVAIDPTVVERLPRVASAPEPIGEHASGATTGPSSPPAGAGSGSPPASETAARELTPPAPGAARPNTPAPSAIAPVARAPSARATSRWAMWGAASASYGDLPSVGAILSAAGEFAVGRIFIRAGGLYGLRRRAEAEGTASAGGRFDLIAGVGDIGWRALPWLGAFLGTEAGLLRGTGYGVSDPGKGNSFWLAPRAGLSALYELQTGLAVTATAEVAIPLSRRTFVLERIGPVHTPGRVVPRLGVGLLWQL